MVYYYGQLGLNPIEGISENLASKLPYQVMRAKSFMHRFPPSAEDCSSHIFFIPDTFLSETAILDELRCIKGT